MKKIISLFMAALMMGATSLTHANDFAFVDAPQVEEVTDNSVTLSWETIEGAEGYIVSYDVVSIENSEDAFAFYTNETQDLILETTTVVEDLEAETDYFFTVTAIDAQGEETPYAPEMMATTLAVDLLAAPSALMVSDVEVNDARNVSITFNAELDNSQEALREFALIDTQGEEIMIENVTLVDQGTVMLTLVDEMAPAMAYNITVIALQDVDGNNVQAGVDGIMSFETPASFDEMDAQMEIMPISAEPEMVEMMDMEVEMQPIEEVSESAQTLPDTGAELYILFIAAILLGGLVAFRRRA